MVYASLGRDVPQEEIWPAIAKPNHSGILSSTTHMMARDALSRDFRAVAVQARHPIQALSLCRQWNIGAILNHRLRSDSPVGHYSVLADIDKKNVILHDPDFGSCRSLSHAELLELWQPTFPESEVVGQMLIGITSAPATNLECEFCHTAVPSTIACANCGFPVSLAPAELLRCINEDCIARMWNYLCCPACDTTFTINVDSTLNTPPAQPGPEEAAGSAVTEESLVGLAPLLSEIEKFCCYILAIPEAAAHPEVKKQLDFLASSGGLLQRAHDEALIHKKAYEKQMSDLVEKTRQNQERHRKKMEDLERQSPPLDGRALGRALLKQLGFTA